VDVKRMTLGQNSSDHIVYISDLSEKLGLNLSRTSVALERTPGEGSCHWKMSGLLQLSHVGGRGGDQNKQFERTSFGDL
jgi:hypothetical protein